MNEALKALTRGETDEERKKRIEQQKRREKALISGFCKRTKTPTRKKIGLCGKVPLHIGYCGLSLKIWTITTL